MKKHRLLASIIALFSIVYGLVFVSAIIGAFLFFDSFNIFNAFYAFYFYSYRIWLFSYNHFKSVFFITHYIVFSLFKCGKIINQNNHDTIF